VGVVLHDRLAKLGGLAHIVLPDSRGATDHPGKYADTSIPGLLGDLKRLGSPASRGRLAAKVLGGASMFRVGEAGNIGQANREAVERILTGLGIPIVARDLGGESGRRIVLDTATGQVSVKVPGEAERQI
jgi:chemotaxis protein CheD